MYGNRYDIYNLALDPVTNFGKVTVTTGYSNTDIAIALVSGHGSRLPVPLSDGDFNLVWWDNTSYSDPSDDPNVEIVRCTTRAIDSLIIVRGQEGTTATNKNTAGHTYKMILAPTKKMFTDIPTDVQSRIGTHAAITSSVHNFNVSGDAPAQAHGLSRHTGTIGSWGQIDKTTSSIADITTKSHTSLSDIGTNTHAQIDTAITGSTNHIAASTNIHGLGIGSAIVGTGNGSSGQYASSMYTTTTTLDWNNGNVQYIVLGNDNNTFTFSNSISGGRYMLVLKQPVSGAAGIVTWPLSVSWAGGTSPTLTTTNGKVDIVTFVYDGTNTKYYGGASLNY